MKDRSGETRRGTMIAVAAILTSACATAEQQQGESGYMAGRQCFLPSQVRGFSAVDRDTVHMTVGPNTVYELDVFGTCPEVDWSQRIGIRSSGGGRWICAGLDAELLVPNPVGVDRCPVIQVRRLSEQEAEAARAIRLR